MVCSEDRGCCRIGKRLSFRGEKALGSVLGSSVGLGMVAKKGMVSFGLSHCGTTACTLQ